MDINPWTGYAGAAAACLAGAGLASWGAVSPTSQIFGATVRRTGNTRTIALTFDDGPNPSVTPALLKLMARYDVKATFFVIGKFAREVAGLTQEVAAAGHCVGNHTDTHPSLVFLPPAKIREELSRCDDAIENATGIIPKWMRPPYGFRNPFLAGLARSGGYKGVVMWSRMARDWKPQPAEGVVSRLRRAKGGDIVLMHDGDHRVLRGDRGHVVKALEFWLPRWKDSGLKFVTLDDFGQDELQDEPGAMARRAG